MSLTVTKKVNGFYFIKNEQHVLSKGLRKCHCKQFSFYTQKASQISLKSQRISKSVSIHEVDVNTMGSQSVHSIL